MHSRMAIVVAAACLGLLAFVADLVDGAAGQVLVALTSSGFAWGVAALLAGRAARDRRGAALSGGVLLVAATLLYYGLVLLVSRRWSGAYLEDGSSADLYGLRSVAIMTGIWVVGSLVAGPLLAILGYTVRTGPIGQAALAAGVAYGLLSGEGWYLLWRLHQYTLGLALSEVARVVLPLVVLTWLTAVHRLGRAWPTLVAASVASGLISALAWYSLASVANNV